MRHTGPVVALALSMLLGVAVALVSIAVHRTWSGILLAGAGTLAAMWALHWWVPRAATTFAAGWLAVLLLAIAGRGEGDYVVSSDTLGWTLIGFGLVVLVTGIVWGRAPTVRRDSGSEGPPA
ncbi:MAG TPA: hypothetical protein VFR87_05040 [Nocardioidaceae bacterium]|nr:hypothetical protein [Nocardioidaceae bacterium]